MRKLISLLSFVTAALLVLAYYQARPSFVSAENLELGKISLPRGFKIELFASGLPSARAMHLGPGGTLFVGSSGAGKVYAVVDSNRDGKADKSYTLASGLTMPVGVTMQGNDLYISSVSKIYVLRNIESRLSDPPALELISDAFPTDGHHGWKFIAFGPDRKLYVPVGAPCNICEKKDSRYASITRMNADGSGLEVFAHGVRNTVGFDWHPKTNELWFTDNGRDWLGDNLPPDELNHAPEKGSHFGYPYCHGTSIKDPEFGETRSCSETVPPAKELGPHVAALGMTFSSGSMFPAEYSNGIFIAEHGSWNRSKPIGYRVTFVRLDDSKAVDYQVFAEGWLSAKGPRGRPVDVHFLPDGSMLISDDYAGAIYRITYSGSSSGEK